MELGPKPPAPKAVKSEAEIEAGKEARRAAKRARDRAARERIAALPPEERPAPKPRAKPRRAATPAPTIEPEGEPEEKLGAFQPKPEIIAVGLKATHELEAHECKWPIGHPGSPDFAHCGRPKGVNDMPYCAAHARVAFLPPESRKAGAEPLKVRWNYRGRR